jgi:phage portal protein BeeE
MEFLNLRKFTLDLVCGVYEVPKDILGYTETSNRSVGEEQSNNFDDTIQSKKHTIANFLTRILREVLGGEYTFEFKIDEQALKVRNIKTAGEAWQSGVAKLNEAREIAHLEADEKRGDEYYQAKVEAKVEEPKKKSTIKVIK